MPRPSVEEKCLGNITLIGGDNNMMTLDKGSDSSIQQTQLLIAAIDHLLALYLDKPEPCIPLLINRNYTLLLENNTTHPDRKNWLNQQQIWWQCYKQSYNSRPAKHLFIF